MAGNPKHLRLGQRSIRIGEDAFTEGLNFQVIGIADYTVRIPGGLVEFTDYALSSPCMDESNDYAANGQVSVTVRVLKNDRGQEELVFFWEEGADHAAAVWKQAGTPRLQHAFAEGACTFEPFVQGQAQAITANVKVQRQDTGEYSTTVQYWLYKRPWKPVPGAPEITQYMLAENWQDDGPWLRRGYDMLPKSFRV